MVRALLRRVAAEPPRWHDDELTWDFATARDQVLGSGLVREAEPGSFSECPGCGPGSMGRVSPIVNRRTGAITLWLPCRNCGVVEIPAESLRIWYLDVPRFAAAISHSLEVQGEPQPFASERGWFLGRASWAGRSQEVFWLRTVHREWIPALKERLSGHPAAIILTSTPELAENWRPHGPQHLVPLGDVLIFDGLLRGDVAAMHRRLVGRSLTKPTRLSKRKNSSLLGHIHQLRIELIEHIQTARKYAFDQRDRTGEFRLLERPTKSQLGVRVGLKRYQVTRCFDDPAGRELVLLWDVAGDLEQILRYGR